MNSVLLIPNVLKNHCSSLLLLLFLLLPGLVMANSFKPKESGMLAIKEVTISDIKPDEKKPEPLPEEKKPEPKPEVRTEKLTEFKIVEKEVVDPVATQEDLLNSQVGTIKNEGVVYDGIAEPKDLDDDKRVIEDKKEEEPGIYPIVQISAKYDGDWVKFLTRNLNAEVPVDNNAPAGRYNVIIQFVVDKEGNVSDIKALTNHGYGMEQEAIRVLKKARGWKPGIQDGREVKSYHRQPITFEVMDNE